MGGRMSDALRQAAEQALDALNTCDPFGYDGHRVSEAINALHAALYAPQQAEPPVEPTVVRIVSYGPDNRYGYRYDPDDAATHIAPGEALAVIKWPTPPADARITDDRGERACYRPGELDDLYRMRAIAAPQQAEPPDEGVRRAAMDDDQIAALRAAALAATPGPWVACARGEYADFDGRSRVVIGDDRRLAVIHVSDDETDANARLFAAASPDAITSLLDRLAQAERERDALRGLLREVREGADEYWQTCPEGADVVARIDAALAGVTA